MENEKTPKLGNLSVSENAHTFLSNLVTTNAAERDSPFSSIVEAFRFAFSLELHTAVGQCGRERVLGLLEDVGVAVEVESLELRQLARHLRERGGAGVANLVAVEPEFLELRQLAHHLRERSGAGFPCIRSHSTSGTTGVRPTRAARMVAPSAGSPRWSGALGSAWSRQARGRPEKRGADCVDGVPLL